MVLFTLEDFAVFKATTLATRMHLIREQLDPKFAEAATVIVPLLQTDQQAIYYAHCEASTSLSQSAAEYMGRVFNQFTRLQNGAASGAGLLG